MASGKMSKDEWKTSASELDREFGGRTLLFCDLLSGRQFAVTPGELKACGSATHEKGTPTICEYRGPEAFSSREFLTGLAEVIRANQTPDGPCVGCRFLVSTKMPERFVTNGISAISLHDFSGCNSHCVYCKGSEYFLPVDYVASGDHELLFKNLLDAGLIKPRTTRVDWGGGEPTLVDTFDRTVNYLCSKGIPEIINTSGIRFSPAVERALKERLATVRVSVDSGTNETYARVKRNRHCDDVWETIARYAATGGDLIAKYIIFSMNSEPNEVESFVKRCKVAGVKRICISVDMRAIWESETSGEKLSEKELEAAAAMYRLARANGIGAYFESIWPPETLQEIARIGGFKLVPNAMVRVLSKAKRVLRGVR